MKDMVKDSVKAALASAFRTAFENSLLPAFQAGTDRMFAQLRSAFDDGLEGMAEQARQAQAQMDAAVLGEVRPYSAMLLLMVLYWWFDVVIVFVVSYLL